MLPFRNILVPVDFGEPSDNAVDVALTIGQRFDSKVTLFHAVWLPGYFYEPTAAALAFPVEDLEKRAAAKLDEVFAHAKARYPGVERRLVIGMPWELILDEIKATSADLVVMGTHGRRGVSHALFGSVAEKIVRHSPVPVLTTPAAPVHSPAR